MKKNRIYTYTHCGKCNIPLTPENSIKEYSICKPCKKEYRKANKERTKIVDAAWGERNPHYQAKWRKEAMKNPEKREKMLTYKNQWISDNREYVNQKACESRNRRYQECPSYRLSRLLRNRFSLAIAKQDKKASVLTLLGCSLEDFRVYIEVRFKEGMSWENRGYGKGKWHLDHILPIASFDLTVFENQKLCWHYTNFQPLWSHENLNKSDKLPNGRRARDNGRNK